MVRKAGFLSFFLLTLAVISGGCSHKLTVKNLSEYRAASINPLNNRVSIGLSSNEKDQYMKRFIQAVGDELKKYSSEVLYPYVPKDEHVVDVMADIRITPEYKGSGVNFLINFPGFLVWAPAWNGYVYKAHYLVDVSLVETRSNEKIAQIEVPFQFNIRHAELDRTWTEISWLEVGIIAFIGGIYATSYDTDITGHVALAVEETVGANVAGQIIDTLNGSGRFGYFQKEKDAVLAENPAPVE